VTSRQRRRAIRAERKRYRREYRQNRAAVKVRGG
jgi:hypothetical protein